MEAHAAYGTFLLCKQPGDGGSEEVMIRPSIPNATGLHSRTVHT